MQLARFVLPWDATESEVDQLLSRAELDFLQLDFIWPRSWPCDSLSDENLFSKWAKGLLSQMKIVHKALFLRPELCVLTNAGGGDTIRAMEAIAEFLTEHGRADMPIAAVRGVNLLSSIECLPKELDLKDRQILSARAEIGGEPLTTALVDGARIVLTGAYDSTAPFLAAAVSLGFCGWHDIELLGNIAAASQFENVLVNIEANGDIELPPEAESQLARIRTQPIGPHADVSCDYSGMSLIRNERKALQITDVFTKPAASTWNVRETYDAGYRATALIETLTQRIAELQVFCSNNFAADELLVRIFTAESAITDQLIRVQGKASTIRDCQKLVGLLQSWLRQNAFGEFAEPSPSVVHLTETMEKQIAVDRLTLSVDTRPASEWL